MADKFIVAWLSLIMNSIRKNRGWKTSISRNSRMNRGTIDSTLEGNTKSSFLIRVIVNLAMLMNKDEFLSLFASLGKAIYAFAEEYGDEFNNQFAKKKEDFSQN